MINPDELMLLNLGHMSYQPALDWQIRLLGARQEDLCGDCVLLVEHPPVLTLGIRGTMDNVYLSAKQLEDMGVETHVIGRGGDVTYHGPGQVVGYPILKLPAVPGSIRIYIQAIENGLISLLKEKFGITAVARDGKYTGVWVGDRKIAAIGVAVKKWVTLHGFAFNVNTDLSHFEWINPCGLSMGVTSVQELTGKKADFDQVMLWAGQYLARELGKSSKNISPQQFMDALAGGHR